MAGQLSIAADDGAIPVKHGFATADDLPAHPELPDPLLSLDGSRITSAADWNAKRKPELKAMLQHYMYGYLPAAPEKVTGLITRENKDFFSGKATVRQIDLSLGVKDCPPIHLLLCLPNKPKSGERSPVVLGLNFNGNHTVDHDPRIALAAAWMPDAPGVVDHKATEASRGSQADRWRLEHAIDRGYAVATFYYGDITPDKAGPLAGIAAHFSSANTTGKDDEWGAIAAWGWGLSRGVDYLQTVPEIDAERIVVFGHSRNGKAALLAGAFDDRIAATIAHQAGCGGSAPSRRHNEKGEPVKAINERFPHWFDGVFKTFVGREDRLPIDQNCLVALCAPRPVLFSCGEEDQWADPPGQLQVLKAADSVYRLLGVDGIAADAQAKLGERIGDRLTYYTRQAPHTVDEAYWDAFLDFADAKLPKQ